MAATLTPLVYGGVALTPAVAPVEGTEEYDLPADAPTAISGYLPVDAALPGRRAALQQMLRERWPALSYREQTLQDEDWSQTWRAHFRPHRIGNVVVRPPWRATRPRPGDVEVVLDPGMAFGTGDHPTTRACLRGLVRLLRPGMRVFDVGTGSGILAIAAAKLGAAVALAVDTDDLAVRAACYNAEANGVASVVQVVHGSLDHPAVAAFGPADLVLANLNSALHAALASAILATVKPGGAVVASGVGAAGLRAVTAAYRAARAGSIRVQRLGEWRALTILR